MRGVHRAAARFVGRVWATSLVIYKHSFGYSLQVRFWCGSCMKHRDWAGEKDYITALRVRGLVNHGA